MLWYGSDVVDDDGKVVRRTLVKWVTAIVVAIGCYLNHKNIKQIK
jgi:hypothetical protein